MRKAIVFLLIFIILLIAPSAARYLRYNQLGNGAAVEPPPTYETAAIEDVPTPPSTPYEDDPEAGEGLVLLDMAHQNQFELDDISFLDGRLAARNVELLPFNGGDLASALRAVNAYIVIAPITEFSADELQAIDDFVERDGRLLLIGDPTRFQIAFEETEFDFVVSVETDKNPLNSVANGFNLIFNDDYLYNTLENEGNFRNILLPSSGFAEDGLVDGLETIAFYGSHSLQVGPGGEALITADDDTWSSATDRPGGLAVAASAADGRVLALGDVQFLADPYYTVYDNSQFIARIADFLVEPSRQRQFVLADFPYFYDQPVDLIYTDSPQLGSDALIEAVALQNEFARADRALSLTAVDAANPDHDALYVGLYNQSSDVTDILASAGISLTIDPPILTAEEERALAVEEDAAADEEEVDEGEEPIEEPAVRLIESSFGALQMSGNTLILLDEEGDQQRIIVLAASQEGLQNSLNLLVEHIPLNTDFSDANCLVEDQLAICPSGVANEEIEAELVATSTATTSSSNDNNSEDTGNDDGGSGDSGDGLADHVDQGAIGLGETASADLLEGESHSWTFSDGPALIDIIVEGSEEIDLALELYNADGEFLDSADAAFTGEPETLTADIPDDGDYFISVRDFFGNEGSYSITIAESDGTTGVGGDGRILIYADDDGQPGAVGATGAESIYAFLSGAYDTTLWSASLDGGLTTDLLAGYDLLIWDSGDYSDEEGFYGEDATAVFDYLDNGGGLLLTGSTPTLFGGFATETAPLSDVEIIGDDPVLTAGFSAGDVILLDQSYDAFLTSELDLTGDGGSVAFMVRGPDSASNGDTVAVAAIDDATNQYAVLLFVPFFALPEPVQVLLLTNLMSWYGL